MKKLKKNTEPTVSVYYDFTDDGKGELRSSADFFMGKYTTRSDKGYFFDLRRISESVFFCGHCGKPLKIKGGGDGDKRQLYFSHRAGEGENCPYHIGNTNLSHEEINRIKYHGQRVGLKHEEIKHFISDCLNNMKGVTATEEKVMRSEIEDFNSAWKRPDITAFFKAGSIGNSEPVKVVFEIQLSTTFFDVIKSREEFYQNNQVFIIWVFDDTFSPVEESQRFAQMDVLASNNHNAYVLDEEAKKKTQETGLLHFTCYNNFYEIVKRKVDLKEMKKSLITLDQLTFDKENYKVYFVDVKKQREVCERLLKQYLEEQRLEAIKQKEDEEERLYRQTKEKYEILIQKNDIITLDKEIDNAPWERKEVIDAFRSLLCYNYEIVNISGISFWLFKNSSKYNIYASDVIRDFEDLDSLLNKKYDLFFIQEVVQWLFSLQISWIMDNCNRESTIHSWNVVRNDEEDKSKRANYAMLFMYQRVAYSANPDHLILLNKKWKIIMNLISIICNKVLHNNHTNTKSVIFEMTNIHPEFAHLLYKVCRYKHHIYESMMNKRNRKIFDIIDETIKTKEQNHELDDLAHCIFPNIF